MSILKECFSQELYCKRMELYLSQEKMAELCYISLRQYIDLENGLRLPSFKTFVGIIMSTNLDFSKYISLLREHGYDPLSEDNIA